MTVIPPPLFRLPADFRNGLIFVAIAVALTALLHATSFVRSLERANLDSFYALQNPGVNATVDIVVISADDYRNIFHGVSPLDPEKVLTIVRGIAAAGAAVIGVDILTEDWSPEVARDLDVSAPVVWVQDVARQGPEKAAVKPVLGGAAVAACRGPEAIHQIFGVVREYEPFVRLAEDDIRPSITRVIEAIAADPSATDCGDAKLPRRREAGPEPIPFVGPSATFWHFTAGTVLTAMASPGWRDRQIMRGRIVLLGGTFTQLDAYETPVQPNMYGVEILANIIAGRRLGEAQWFIFLGVDAAVGVALILLGHFVGGVWRLAFMVGAVVAVSLGSLFLFQYFRFYLSFMPVMIGVTVHFLIEEFQGRRELAQANAELKRANEALTEQLRHIHAQDNELIP